GNDVGRVAKTNFAANRRRGAVVVKDRTERLTAGHDIDSRANAKQCVTTTRTAEETAIAFLISAGDADDRATAILKIDSARKRRKTRFTRALPVSGLKTESRVAMVATCGHRH